MKPKKHDTCVIEGCTDPVRYPIAGLCHACYQWDHNHRKLGHGIGYFLQYAAKTARLAARADTKIKATKVRRMRRA